MTTDPDGDSLTDDALDVVNMSLGRRPDPEEPLSQAVNNAVLRGVTFVIAAGNDYNFQSIGTPGIAEHAITVGAVDQNRFTAYSSSKGPVENTFLLKPDVAAPGVDIYSSILNGQYSHYSGTSMGTAHVSGVAALLLEKHPTWTPAMIKSSLMTTATSMQAQVWEQGAGVIDAFAAITNDILLSPGSISFGATDNSPEGFHKTSTLTITNASSQSRDFSLSLEGTIQNSAINLSFSESVFSLQPAETKTVEVNLTVDPSLPLLNIPDAYSGNIVLSSSDGSVVRKSVVTLVNPPVTRLQFVGELPLDFIVIGLEGNYYWQPFFPTEPTFDLYLPAGKYDIITHYNYNRTVISEGISSATTTTIQLEKAMAKNAIVFAPRDKNGQPIPLWSGHGGAFFTGEGKNIVTIYFGAVDTLYINDQKDYGYDQKIFAKSIDGSNDCYEVAVSTGFGIDRSMLLSNDGNFTRFQLVNPSIPREAPQDLTYFLKAAYFTTWTNQPMSVVNPLTVYRSQNDSSKFGGSYVRLDPEYGSPGFAWETGAWKINSNNDIYFTDAFDKYLGTIPGEFEYEFGTSLLKLNAYTANTDTRIALTEFPSSGIFNRFYGEREHGGVSYKLSSGGTVLTSGLFNNPMITDFGPTLKIDFPAQAQLYQLELSYESYQVGGRFGQATATLEFNTAGNDKNSPLLDYISLEANGVSTTEIATPESAMIKFKVMDTWPDYATGTWIYPSGIAEVTLEIKEQGDESWLPLSVSQNDVEEWFASLPSDLDSGYYQLRVKAKDNENNLFTYVLNPGFLIGSPSSQVPYATVILLEPFNNSINTGVRPLFKWSAFEDAAYNIQVSRTSDFTNLVIDELATTNEFQPQADLKQDSVYYWRVKALLADGSTPWSEVKSFEARQLAAPILISPANDAVNVEVEQVVFQWEKAQGASVYNVEISYTEDFSALMASVWLPESESTLDWYGFTQGTQYFWRVTAYYYTYDNAFAVASETFNFTTIKLETPEGPKLLTPHNHLSHVPYRHVSFNWKKSSATLGHYFELSYDSMFQSVMRADWLSHTTTQVHVRNLDPGTNYYWRVTAYGDNYMAAISETFSFKTSSHVPPKLRFPENRQGEVQHEDVTFAWDRGESAQQYYFELSEDAEFSQTKFRILTDEQSLKLTGLDPEKVYYWRITSTSQTMSDKSAISSEVFTFSTAHSSEPASDFTMEVYPNPFNEKVSVVVYAAKAQQARFTVVNQVGQSVKSSSHQLEQGFNTIEWSVTDPFGARLPDGIYLGIIEGLSARKTVKLILKRR